MFAKGAPGSESRTGPRLVSPAAGGEKKNGTYCTLGSELTFYWIQGTFQFIYGQYSRVQLAVYCRTCNRDYLKQNKLNLKYHQYQIGRIFKFKLLIITHHQLKKRFFDQILQLVATNLEIFPIQWLRWIQVIECKQTQWVSLGEQNLYWFGPLAVFF